MHASCVESSTRDVTPRLTTLQDEKAFEDAELFRAHAQSFEFVSDGEDGFEELATVPFLHLVHVDRVTGVVSVELLLRVERAMHTHQPDVVTGD